MDDWQGRGGRASASHRQPRGSPVHMVSRADWKVKEQEPHHWRRAHPRTRGRRPPWLCLARHPATARRGRPAASWGPPCWQPSPAPPQCMHNLRHNLILQAEAGEQAAGTGREWSGSRGPGGQSDAPKDGLRVLEVDAHPLSEYPAAEHSARGAAARPPVLNASVQNRLEAQTQDRC